jgi:inosine/xanthosine triphosphatase
VSDVFRPAGLEHVRTVRVGTRNGPKLEAVRQAIGAYLPEVEVIGHAVQSGVAEQPVGYAEIVAGATQRARAARAAGPCELGIGIEDGLVEIVEIDHRILNVGAAVVTDGRRDAVGLSSGFAYPPVCAEQALAAREPIGGLFDALWCGRDGEPVDTEPSALSVGNVGRLSRGVLTRAEYGRHAVLCALVQFLHPDLYFASSADGGPSAATPTRRAPVPDEGTSP